MATLIDPSQILGGVATGGINYVSNNLAEVNTDGWATYADAAGTAPVDGTGGSPAVTWTRNTSSPLRGVADFLFTKDAVNRQGQGVSYDFTINNADKAQPIYISFDYVTSANFADNDMSVWIYDVTNALVVQPAPYLLKKVNQSETFAAVFQSASNSTSYRLIIHVGSTNATAYTLNFDNFKVGPSYAVMGSPITDWKAYTPTTQGLGTLGGGSTAFYRRNGDSIDIMARLLTGTVTAVEARVYLPSGLSVDTAKLAGGRTVIAPLARETATAGNIVAVQANSAASNYLTFGTWSNAGTPFVVSTGTGLFGNSEQISFSITIPVLGWSSSVLMSDNADTRVVAASFYRSTSQSIGTGGGATKWTFDSRQFDTHGAADTSNNRYNIPVAGTYRFTLTWVETGSSTGHVQGAIWRNGSYARAIDRTAFEDNAIHSASTIIPCDAGDYIEVYWYNYGSASINILGGATGGYAYSVCEVERLSGPSQIAATETVSLRYTQNSNNALTANVTNASFTTKVHDSHGAWNGTVFTVPVSGIYSITGSWRTTASIAQSVEGYVNGSNTIGMCFLTSNIVPFVGIIRLLAGDTFSIRSGTNCTQEASAANNWMSINRIGNYV